MESQQHNGKPPETGDGQAVQAEQRPDGAETALTGTGAPQPEQVPENRTGSFFGPPHHPWNTGPLPPGYAIDPATGRIVPVGPFWPPPPHPGHFGSVHPGFASANPESPEQAAARQAARQQQQGLILQSFEQFIAGKATVSEVVKNLYTGTAQNDQLWKGVLVGAAVAVLLTSKPVRDAMGKTCEHLFPGLHRTQPASKSADSLQPEKE